MSSEAFFAYARERQAILLRRRAGLPRSEWTKDKILQEYRFCNVFREDDTTTIWLRENVRDRLRDRPEVLLAVVVYRWFNRIRTGEAIFSQLDISGHTAWDSLLDESHSPRERSAVLKSAIQSYCGAGPYVTGSYIIKTPDAMPKLDGVLWCVREFMSREVCMPGVEGPLSWRAAASLLTDACVTLEMMWNWLRRHSHLGDFMAYEVVTDLRYTALLDTAPDIMTWANAGPGAVRGLNRIHGRPKDGSIPKAQSCQEMRDLLALSRLSHYWPSIVHDSVEVSQNWFCRDEFGGVSLEELTTAGWSQWDMRTVEHTLCEFDKYERVRLGEGAPRQKFRSKV